MDQTRFQLFTPLDTPDYDACLRGLPEAAWPLFMLYDPIADRLWDHLVADFPEYQFALRDLETGKAVAQANSLPLHWDADSFDLPEGGWDWAFAQGVADQAQGLAPRTQCALQIAIHPDYRGQGFSTWMVEHMRSIGAAKGFARLIAPVRPSQKSQYPLIPMAEYIQWKTAAGLPFDAWLRVHVRLGARIVKPCHQAMEIRGSRADWERWTGLTFPGSGQYVLPGGLAPLEFDARQDQGVYIEPNVWTVHDLHSQAG